MKWGIGALFLVLVGGMAWIRLAPDDPARWHVELASLSESHGWVLLPPGSDPIITNLGGAASELTLSEIEPEAVLARLDRIALATPRTVRLAGSPEEGRITWVTRSAFFGFPDYTTAEARTDGPVTVLRVWARLRYGRRDFGVNAARLRDWLAQLSPG